MSKATIICHDCNASLISPLCSECGRELNYFNRWEAVCRHCKREHKKSDGRNYGRFYAVSQIITKCECGNSNLYFRKIKKIQ